MTHGPLSLRHEVRRVPVRRRWFSDLSVSREPEVERTSTDRRGLQPNAKDPPGDRYLHYGPRPLLKVGGPSYVDSVFRYHHVLGPGRRSVSSRLGSPVVVQRLRLPCRRRDGRDSSEGSPTLRTDNKFFPLEKGGEFETCFGTALLIQQLRRKKDPVFCVGVSPSVKWTHDG